jgi:hypothetical protein
MRYAPRAILAGGLGFAASFVVACGGGSGLLSGDQSSALSSQADAVSSAVQSGNCGAAVNASAVLSGDVQTLPATVNSTLRSNLSQGASTIAQLAQRDCHQHTASTGSTPTTSSTTSSTSTSASTSTSTSTTTPTSTTTTTTTTTPTTATTPTDTGTTSTTTGGVGLGGGTTTGGDTGNSGGTGPANGNSNGGGG